MLLSGACSGTRMAWGHLGVGNVHPPNVGGGEGLSGQREGGSNKVRLQALIGTSALLFYFFYILCCLILVKEVFIQAIIAWFSSNQPFLYHMWCMRLTFQFNHFHCLLDFSHIHIIEIFTNIIYIVCGLKFTLDIHRGFRKSSTNNGFLLLFLVTYFRVR